LIKRQKISVTGRVQGVGFRPFVYRLASELNLVGFVYNDTKGVAIEIQGPNAGIAEFTRRLQSQTQKPPLLRISTCKAVDVPAVIGAKTFTIKLSDTKGTALSQITVDTAACADCLSEMADKNDFRYRYPFINCTNCGPRYSIIKTIPYDRPNTTMSAFKMCDNCLAQYSDVADRRFHAQPVACSACGPSIYLTDNKADTICTDSDEVIRRAVRMLLAGRIVAIKGIGGFHLTVDALNDKAVARLRRRKHRDHKPFAMMAGAIETIKEYAIVTTTAEDILKSPQSPIILLPKIENAAIAPSVAPDVGCFGFMLCYAPLHHLLFAEKPDGSGPIKVLVATSGNISDEPLICENDEALKRLGDVADAFVMHNRQIYRQVDDSVVHIIADEPVLLRRSRGYVPSPVLREKPAEKDIFAAGADLKNTFCFVKQNQLILSEHIGDLEDAIVYHHYLRSIEHLQSLFEVSTELVVCDLHPGYLSTQHALAMPNVNTIQVQHHWAHIASVLAEFGFDGPVIGLCADGTGYGTDGAIWGCECLIASLGEFRRFGHLRYYPLPGADKAGKEAIRPALSLLRESYGDDFDPDDLQPLLSAIEPDKDKQNIILRQLQANLNTIQSSSLGRVFDAVTAILGLGFYNHFDAQLPMALESIAGQDVRQRYDFRLNSAPDGILQLDLGIMLRQLIDDVRAGCERCVISAKFHNTVAAGLLDLAVRARDDCNLDTVALSGGVFCNRYLTNRLITLLKERNFCVLFNRYVPANDGGIALGQAAIAADSLAKRVKI